MFSDTTLLVSGFGFRDPNLGFRFSGARLRVSGFGFRVLGFGFRVQDFGFGFRVLGFGFRVQGFGFRVSGLGLRVSGFSFRVQGFGFRVSGLPRATRGGARRRPPPALHFRVYLTRCVHQMALDSRHPHKFVNLLFSLVIVHNKMTILWGSCFLKLINEYICKIIPHTNHLQLSWSLHARQRV